MKQAKGIQGFLNEDKSLTEKVSYEEFIGKKVTPKDSDEVSIDEAYQSYCDIKNCK